MKIRIKPSEIDLSGNDPFENDLLQRKTPIEVFTRLVENIEGLGVLALDGAWGTGKTTFIQMWAKHLKQSKFPVVTFNAWDTDYSEDPLIALATELTGELSKEATPETKRKLEHVKAATREVLRWTAPGAVRLLASAVPIVGAELGNVLSTYAEEKQSAHGKVENSVAQFRQTLSDLAAEISRDHGHKPLVVFIDELDRCRPTYAIELLETAKHLFAVNNVIFVLAINRSELAHSIRSVYGNDFDATGYLRRFIDLDLQLPEPDRSDFIKSTLKSVGIQDYLLAGPGADRSESECAILLINRFFMRLKLSPREISQALHRLGVVVRSLSEHERPFMLTIVALLMIRVMDYELCRKIELGELTDEAAVGAVFKSPGMEPMRGTPEGNLIEAVIIGAKLRPGVPMDEQLGNDMSPLLRQYRDLEQVGSTNSPEEARELSHATGVIRQVNRFIESRITPDNGLVTDHLNFQRSVERLELLWLPSGTAATP